MTAGAATAPRGVAVPAYFHPAVAAADWRELAAAGPAVRAVVLNVADGPGPAPERELTAAAVRTGHPLYGYVDTDYGARPVDTVLDDLRRYHDWYPTTGIFLDRVPTAAAMVPRFALIVAAARRLGATSVVFNHGAYPDPGYAALADAMVTFEGPDEAHRSIRVPDWARELPAERFWHLVYDTPRHFLGAALRRAADGNVGVVYVTDRAGVNPWDGLPPYFDVQVRACTG
jgi:hypothetical protein